MILTTEQLEPIKDAVEQNAVRYWANAFICERITSLLDTIADFQRQLAEAHAMLGMFGFEHCKAKFDAYVQEKVASKFSEAIAHFESELKRVDSGAVASYLRSLVAKDSNV